MNIMEPLSKLSKENQYIVVMTDSYFRLTRAVQTAQITISSVAFIFLYG